MRREEIPALLHIARQWVGKSVDDLGHKYEQMVPDYETEGSDHAFHRVHVRLGLHAAAGP